MNNYSCYINIILGVIDYSWWNDDNYVILSQNGDTPVISYFSEFSLLKSLQIDHQDRSGATMQGVSVSNWFQNSYTFYVVASVKTNVDGTQYPWLSTFNTTGQNIEFHTCVNTKLKGAYNKESNLNYIIANLATSTNGGFLRIAARSQDFGGI